MEKDVAYCLTEVDINCKKRRGTITRSVNSEIKKHQFSKRKFRLDPSSMFFSCEMFELQTNLKCSSSI